MKRPLILAYAGCSTCKNALRWLDSHGIAYDLRPIVEQPPTRAELGEWIGRSKVGVRKWLNTSGQSYRALVREGGREKIDVAKDAEIAEWLTNDGKLVKRPVLVLGERVVVGFQPDVYESLFRPRGSPR